MCMVLHRANMEGVVLSNYVTGSARSEIERVALCRHQPTVLPFPPYRCAAMALNPRNVRLVGGDDASSFAKRRADRGIKASQAE